MTVQNIQLHRKRRLWPDKAIQKTLIVLAWRSDNTRCSMQIDSLLINQSESFKSQPISASVLICICDQFVSAFPIGGYLLLLDWIRIWFTDGYQSRRTEFWVTSYRITNVYILCGWNGDNLFVNNMYRKCPLWNQDGGHYKWQVAKKDGCFKI